MRADADIRSLSWGTMKPGKQLDTGGNQSHLGIIFEASLPEVSHQVPLHAVALFRMQPARLRFLLFRRRAAAP